MQDRRKALGLTAQELAKETESLGYPISRVAISKIESNSRSGKIDLAEIAVLASALGVPPVLLLYPGLPHTSTRYLPNAQHYAIDALMWFTGENSILAERHGPATWEQIKSGTQPLTLSRQFFRAKTARHIAVLSARKARYMGDAEEADEQMKYAQEQFELCEQILDLMRSLDLPVSKFANEHMGQPPDA